MDYATVKILLLKSRGGWVQAVSCSGDPLKNDEFIGVNKHELRRPNKLMELHRSPLVDGQEERNVYGVTKEILFSRGILLCDM